MLSIPGYTLEEELHESARTAVYRGTRESDGRAVVLKVLNRDDPSPHEIAGLGREHAIMTEVAHEGVLASLVFEQGERCFLVFEDFGGRALQLALPLGELSVERFLELAIQMGRALGEVHRRGVIHRDVNPRNFLINVETGAVKIADFGLATKVSRREAEGTLNPNELKGTLAYIAPEQTGRINRRVDYRADLYSLGATYYHVLTGEAPHESATDAVDLVYRHIAKTPRTPHEVMEDVPEAVSRIIMKLLEKNAEDRYQSTSGLVADLEDCAQQLRETGSIELRELASKDVSDRFSVSQKLYGRETQTGILMEAFERARNGRCELLLIGGYAGIGKSALVSEAHRPITANRGMFTSGKFEQFKRDIPYAGFVEAFKKLVRQLLAGSTEEIRVWRSRLMAVLKPNAQVLIDVIAELELILGEQPRVALLDATETQNRFKLLFQRFFGVFASADHPLVLFLDDLQWAGAPTLNLLQALLTAPEGRHALIIGAYRDNEVDESHSLRLTLKEIEKQGGIIRELHLPPLDQDELCLLTSDTLHCTMAEAADLADLLMVKTHGNPFFVNQFFSALHAQGQLEFDYAAAKWTWDVDRIVEMGITDNVVDLMTGRLETLPAATLDALRLGACIGNRFTLETLAEISDAAPADIETALEPALIAGLVLESLDGADYRFLHDRVEEAAYALTEPAARTQVHLDIGRLLARNLGDADSAIFEITHHFNESVDLITDPEERLRVAALNLRAGKRAKESTAYDPAVVHLRAGVALLADDAWSHHELAFRIHTELAESEYLRARFDTSEELFDVVLSKAQTPIEKAGIQHMRAVQFINTGRMLDALIAAKDALRGLGVEIPEPEDVGAGMERELEEVSRHLGDRAIADLLDAPDMQDPAAMLGVTLLQDMWIAAYIAGDQALAGYATVSSMNMCLRHGNAAQSGFVYAMYGVIAGSVLGDFAAGAEYGRLALALAKRPDAGAVRAKVALIAGALVTCWSEPLEDSYSYLRDGYHAGIENGDMIYAGYNVELLIKEWTIRGGNVAEIHDSCKGYLPFLERQQDTNVLNLVRSELKFLLSLMGKTDVPFGLTHEDFDEAEHVAVLENPDLLIFFHWYMLLKLQLLFFQEEFEAAAEWVRRAEDTDLPTVLLGHIQVVEFFFYAGLTMAALHDEADEGARQTSIDALTRYRDALKGWLDKGCHPDVLEHKLLLLDAELARIDGAVVEAMDLYDRSIRAAAETGYTPNEAIANHVAGRFFLGLGRNKVARAYLTDARNLYERWGATAVAEALEARYEARGVRRAEQAPHSASSLSSTWSGTTSSSGDGFFDMLSVVKATQAISNEIQLDRLLRSALDVVMENAGARRGRLLLERDGSLVVEASIDVDGESTFLEGVPLEESQDLAVSVVQFTARTREVVLLSDASEDARFLDDPYIREHQSKAMLCIPLIHRGDFIGAVYLENDLSTGVFTEDRLEVLSVLASQAAISLENARLYRTLEQRVEERTRALRAMQKQLVVQEKMASLGNLTSGIAHEIRNPLNFVNNFAQTCDLGLEDLIAAIKAGKRLDEEDSELAEIVSDLRAGVRSIRTHGLRADKIVRSMMQHAAGASEGAREVTDVNVLLEQGAEIARHAFTSQHPGFDIEIVSELDPELDNIRLEPGSVSRALVNILKNACYFAHARQLAEGESFAPELRLRTANAATGIEIRIRDNGVGIPEDAMEKLFLPFFTTKPTGEGVGLGMSLTHDIIVDQHNGRIDVRSEPGVFTEFIISLPRTQG